MKKKTTLIILIILFLAVILFVVSSKNNKNIGTKNCIPYHSDDFKYENNIFDFGFNYNNDVVICERYPFNRKKYGLELRIWNKEDFDPLLNSLDGLLVSLYINKTVTLSPYLFNLYNQDGFVETGVLVNNNKIFKKTIQESTCDIPRCIYTVYKFENNKNKFLIKEYSEIDEIIKSFHGLLEEK